MSKGAEILKKSKKEPRVIWGANNNAVSAAFNKQKWSIGESWRNRKSNEYQKE